MKVLVTGANGFLGSVLCEKLTQEEGCIVVGSIRDDAPLKAVKGVEYVSVGNIGTDTDWSKALHGVDVVCHCAARVHVTNEVSSDPLEEFRAVNVNGTLHLGRHAARMGVRRFLFVSSIKVNGEQTDSCPPFTPEDLPAPEDPYGVSKWEAEEGLRALAEETGMEVVIIRPPLVYGPGVGGNFSRLLKLAQTGVPLPFGAVNNRRTMVYSGNLVDFMSCSARSPAAANQTFLVGDGESLSTAQLLRLLRASLGRPAMLLPVPVQWFWWLGRLLNKTPVIQRLFGSLQVDISKSKELLGWEPPFTAEQGLANTVKKQAK